MFQIVYSQWELTWKSVTVGKSDDFLTEPYCELRPTTARLHLLLSNHHHPNIPGFLPIYGTLPNVTTISAETLVSKLNPQPSQGVLHRPHPRNPATDEGTGTGTEADPETEVCSRVSSDHLSVRPCYGEIVRYARSPTHLRRLIRTHANSCFQVLELGTEVGR